MSTGCGRPAVDNGRCTKHARAHNKRLNRDKDAKRPSASGRGYGHKWRQASKGFKREHPLCVICEDEGQIEPVAVVDHIIPHRGDMKLFWDRNNWQSLCKRHHDQKTAKEDGGFGKQSKRADLHTHHRH